jgi:hypothetical protein
MDFFLAATLFLVNTLDGRVVYINPEQVVSLAPTTNDEMFAKGVRCVIGLSDGKFVSAREDCANIQMRMIKGDG